MGSLYRSQYMSYCRILFPPEAAYNCLIELGDLERVAFINLNPDISALNLTFAAEIKRCDDMDVQLSHMVAEMIKERIVAPRYNQATVITPDMASMIDMEELITMYDTEVHDCTVYMDVLTQRYFDLVENKHLLEKLHIFLSEAQKHFAEANKGDQKVEVVVTGKEASGKVVDTMGEKIATKEELKLAEGMQTATTFIGRIKFISGIILRSNLPAFQKMLWRVCKDNVLLKTDDISFDLYHPGEDGDDGEFLNQSAILIFYQGEHLETKITKICQSFHATLFNIPESVEDRVEMGKQLEKSIKEYTTVLISTHERRRRRLLEAAPFIKSWLIQIRKMKAIYGQLNMFTVNIGANVIIAECWIPVKSKEKVFEALERGIQKSGSDAEVFLQDVETEEVPPTFFDTDLYTYVFQKIIDSYGIATYREINLSPFSIITFPFLFSVMFGDAGHGFLVLCAAIAMLVFEKKILAHGKIRNEISKMFFGGRYILFLMGLFSIYSGFMYNDFFSKPINFCKSQWYPESPYYDRATVLWENSDLQFNPNPGRDYHGSPYYFGMDTAWMLAENKIAWLNSYKMKLSVIFGVSQMLFGNVLGLFNHIYFHEWLSIVMEFIPMMVFLLVLFGYLSGMIFAKWVIQSTATSQCAPSLLIALINMFLQSKGECSTAHFYDPAQKTVQSAFLALVFICIVWILLPKPLIVLFMQKIYEHRMKKLEGQPEKQEKLRKAHMSRRQAVHAPKEFHFGEIFIHQCIHTIEYCLGCISHTASYLRLWALSLAHAQLSEVLWMFLVHYINSGGLTAPDNQGMGVVLWIAFGVWAVLTVAILLLMEGLSAFLHTLRLHWVEFQSKFYEGDGWEFLPFSFSEELDKYETVV